jgi:LPS export ABC transporter protein LptC
MPVTRSIDGSPVAVTGLRTDRFEGGAMNHKEIERWHRLRNIKKAFQILVFVCAALLVSGVAASILFRPVAPPMDPPSQIKHGIEIVNFSYSSPGPQKWELHAPSALVSEALDAVELKEPKVVYHDRSGASVELISRIGTFDRKNLSVTASGDVTMRYRDYVFRSPEINYSHEKLRAETSSPVAFEGPDLKITGKGLTLSLDSEEIVIEEDVHAQLFNVNWVKPNGRLPM